MTWKTARLIFAVSRPQVVKSISKSSSWRFRVLKETEAVPRPVLSAAMSAAASVLDTEDKHPALTKSHTSNKRASWYTARGGGRGFAAMFWVVGTTRGTRERVLSAPHGHGSVHGSGRARSVCPKWAQRLFELTKTTLSENPAAMPALRSKRKREGAAL